MIFSKREVSYIRQGKNRGALKDNVCAMAVMHERDARRFIFQIVNLWTADYDCIFGSFGLRVAFQVVPLSHI